MSKRDGGKERLVMVGKKADSSVFKPTNAQQQATHNSLSLSSELLRNNKEGKEGKSLLCGCSCYTVQLVWYACVLMFDIISVVKLISSLSSDRCI
jgi:hypothetical protein